MNKTAMQRLIDYMKKYYQLTDVDFIIEYATNLLEKEKEQIIDSYVYGHEKYRFFYLQSRIESIDRAEKHYNETYGEIRKSYYIKSFGNRVIDYLIYGREKTPMKRLIKKLKSIAGIGDSANLIIHEILYYANRLLEEEKSQITSSYFYGAAKGDCFFTQGLIDESKKYYNQTYNQ
jgi:hypothetical protein